MAKVFRPWFIGAVVVLALGVLYNFGILDSLVEAIYSRSDQGTVPAQSPEKAMSVEQSAENPEGMTADDPGSQVVGEDSDQEINQVDSEQDSSEEPPDVPIGAPAENDEIVSDIVPQDDNAPVKDIAPPGEGGYFIHIYSFRTPERADSFIRRWDHPEDSLSIVVQEVRGVSWHRVYLGPYASRGEALLVALRHQQNQTIDYYKIVALPPSQGS